MGANLKNGFCSVSEQLEKNRVKARYLCLFSLCLLLGWLCHGLTLLRSDGTKIVAAYAFLFIESAETVTDGIGLKNLITKGSQLPLSAVPSCMYLCR